MQTVRKAGIVGAEMMLGIVAIAAVVVFAQFAADGVVYAASILMR